MRLMNEIPIYKIFMFRFTNPFSRKYLELEINLTHSFGTFKYLLSCLRGLKCNLIMQMTLLLTLATDFILQYRLYRLPLIFYFMFLLISISLQKKL